MYSYLDISKIWVTTEPLGSKNKTNVKNMCTYIYICVEKSVCQIILFGCQFKSNQAERRGWGFCGNKMFLRIVLDCLVKQRRVNHACIN